MLEALALFVVVVGSVILIPVVVLLYSRWIEYLYKKLG